MTKENYYEQIREAGRFLGEFGLCILTTYVVGGKENEEQVIGLPHMEKKEFLEKLEGLKGMKYPIKKVVFEGKEMKIND